MTPAPLRVLLVNHVARLSGAEHSLLALVDALDRRRFALCAACPEGPLLDRLEAAGLRCLPVAMERMQPSRGPLRLLRSALRQRRAIRDLAAIADGLRADLLHAVSTEAFLAAGQAADRCRRPAVWHARDLVSLRGAGPRIARRAARVIAISRAVVRDLVRQRVPPDKIITIYNGIDADAFRSAARKGPWGAPLPDGRLLTMVAQLVPWKRHGDFLRAMALVAKEHPDARGLIVGADLFGDQPRYVKALHRLCADLGLADRVHLLGHRDDVPAILEHSEVLVMPSQREPFGRAALEAMALGKPVVGTRSGGLPEVVEDGVTGLLVPVARPDRLARTISRLLADPALARRMGAAGEERARRLFSIRRHAEQVAKVYEELATATMDDGR